jgi:DNA polymerase-3 subunit epsilon
MSEAIFIALDFETTGLNPDKDGIIEMGAVKFTADGTILDKFEQLTNPGIRISSDAQSIHGIKTLDLKGQPSPVDAWNMLIEWAGEFTAFVAHNAEFEVHYLRPLVRELEKPADYMFVDTLELSRRRLKNEKNYKLSSLIPEIKGAHRALNDATACSKLYLKIAETYKTGKIPTKTSFRPMSSFKKYDNRPTERQKNYIRDLGGKPNKPQTKQEASVYIDKLKSGGGKGESSTIRNIFILVLVIFVFWLVFI